MHHHDVIEEHVTGLHVKMTSLLSPTTARNALCSYTWTPSCGMAITPDINVLKRLTESISFLSIIILPVLISVLEVGDLPNNAHKLPLPSAARRHQTSLLLVLEYSLRLRNQIIYLIDNPLGGESNSSIHY